MASDRDDRIQTLSLKPLTRNELDQQIQSVASQVAGDALVDPSAEASWDERLKPRWIRPADLVRRMSPYIVYN
jgi:hypothetical protein